VTFLVILLVLILIVLTLTSKDGPWSTPKILPLRLAETETGQNPPGLETGRSTTTIEGV